MGLDSQHVPPRKWIVPQVDPSLLYLLSSQMQVSPVLARMLINRGITSVEEARYFLYGDLRHLADPLVLPGIKEGVKAILQAVNDGQKIMVYGDYDVDGVCSTALLVKVLTNIGANVTYYIPNRLDEGYGLNSTALEYAADQGINLIITVDCGIRSCQEVEVASSLGLQVIITDHHQPGDVLPNALAVINPLLGGEEKTSVLAGVGVAFKLAQALLGAVEGGNCYLLGQEYLDLVALGTVADMVPLTGENRLLTKFGLPQISSTQNVGLQALLAVTGLEGQQISPWHVGFVLAPRLNAAGRLGKAEDAAELLLTDSRQKAWELAKKLHMENEKRQAIESQILKNAIEKVEQEIDLERDRVIVLASSLWHSGIIGIVASRLAEKYYRPTVLIALEGNVGTGSARSIPGFHISKALDHCKRWLIRHGGHELAAGLSIEEECIEAFRREINCYASQKIDEEMLIPTLEADFEIFFSQVDRDLLNQLEMLYPFGQGNPEPLMIYRDAQVLECREVGKNGEHLKLKVGAEQVEFESIGFGLAPKTRVSIGDRVDLLFGLEMNSWNGADQLQLKIKDLKLHVEGSASDRKIKRFEQRTMQIKAIPEKYLLVTGSPAQLIVAITEMILDKSMPGRAILIVTSGASMARNLYQAMGETLRASGVVCWQLNILTEAQITGVIQRTNTEKTVLFLSGSCLLGCKDRLLAIQDQIELIIWAGGTWKDSSLDGFPLFTIKEIADWFSGARLVVMATPGPRQFMESLAGVLKCSHVSLGQPVTYYPNIGRTLNDWGQLVSQRGSSGKTVIYVANKHEALKVYNHLLSLDPGLKWKIGYFHFALWYSLQKQVLDMFNFTPDAILVTTRALPSSWLEGEMDLVFTSLPMGMEELIFLAYPGPKNRVNKITFMSGAGQKTSRILDTLFPNRKTLALVYNIIKRTALGEHTGKAGKYVLEVLRKHRELQLSPYTVQRAVAILAELGLLSGKSKSDKKVELLDSWRIQEGERERKRVNDFLSWLEEIGKEKRIF